MVKKRGQEHMSGSLDDLLARPWCYYCDKEFDDVKVLSDHQKQKHFRCLVDGCHRRLNSAGGLRVHMHQVHKLELQKVENALDGREGLDVEIFAMFGIPDHIAQQREERVRNEWFKMRHEHYVRTGNRLPGDDTFPIAKKPKVEIESREEIKARVQALKAAKEAQKAAKAAAANGETSAQSTPPQSNANAPPAPPPAVTGYESNSHLAPNPWSQTPLVWSQPSAPVAMGGYGAYATPPPAAGYNGLAALGAQQPYPSYSATQPLPAAGIPVPGIPIRGTSVPGIPVPGLPQRPASSAQPANLPQRPSFLAAPSFDDSVEAMIKQAEQVASSAEYREAREAEARAAKSGSPPAAATLPKPATPDESGGKAAGKSKKKAREIMKLAEKENGLSWEEVRASFERYQKKKQSSEYVIGTATDAVTGVVEAAGGAGEIMV